MKRVSTRTGREITPHDDHVNGVRKGYEDCAIFVDGIGADVAKQIRLLKESI